MERKLLRESEALGVEKDLGQSSHTGQGSLYDVSTCSSPHQICTPTVMGSSLSGSTVVYLWTVQTVGGEFLTTSPASLHFSHVDLPLSLHVQRVGSSFLHMAEGGDQVFPADVSFLHSVDECRGLHPARPCLGPAIHPFPPEKARCVAPARVYIACGPREG